MPLLKTACIREIHRIAIEAQLDRNRETMLSGLDPAYVSSLAEEATPAAQLFRDLMAMNRDERIAADVIPLEEWLLTAKALSSQFPDRQKFFNDKAEEVIRATGSSAADHVAQQLLPERILFRNDLLPAQFMAGAFRTSKGVARLVVPQIVSGVRRVSASRVNPANSYGTGWLIGSAHLMTSWHVLEARAIGEPRPALDDVLAQCAASIAEFDFDEQDAPPVFTRKVERLEHHNATLDYALLASHRLKKRRNAHNCPCAGNRLR